MTGPTTARQGTFVPPPGAIGNRLRFWLKWIQLLAANTPRQLVAFLDWWQKMDQQERQQLSEAMHRVFTPGFPIYQQDLFRGRIPQLEKILQTVPSPGRHPIIFGQRGVGKTSFVNILTQFFLSGMVKVTCDGSDSFKSIWNRVFQKVTIDFKERAFGFSRQESEHKINLATFLGRENEAVNGIGAADIAGILSLLKNRAVFVIDEFDRVAGEDTKAAMADLIKNLSDNNPNVTLVLVGVGQSITDLIGEHPSIGRNLVQVEMPLMADAEIKEIVFKQNHYRFREPMMRPFLRIKGRSFDDD